VPFPSSRWINPRIVYHWPECVLMTLSPVPLYDILPRAQGPVSYRDYIAQGPVSYYVPFLEHCWVLLPYSALLHLS
jgi:hypothetical protein